MRRVKDLVQRDVATVTPDASVSELVRTLEERGASEAAVVDCDRVLLGVASVRDILELTRSLQDVPAAMRWGLALSNPLGERARDGGAGDGELFPFYVTPAGHFVDVRDRVRELAGDTLRGYSVKDIMKGPPVTIASRAGLPELAQLLRNRGLPRVLVVEGDLLVGTVSTTELLEGLWGSVPYGESDALSGLPPAVGCPGA